ncbi:unnamed protein product [Durusdinium trenchii]|uniref:Tetratricopeptide repeat-containing protein n=1 Tax=Durusdinium trenchii TaxID=1381693 RepID=A0ABP0PTU8_9DINO
MSMLYALQEGDYEKAAQHFCMALDLRPGFLQDLPARLPTVRCSEDHTASVRFSKAQFYLKFYLGGPSGSGPVHLVARRGLADAFLGRSLSFLVNGFCLADIQALRQYSRAISDTSQAIEHQMEQTKRAGEEAQEEPEEEQDAELQEQLFEGPQEKSPERSVEETEGTEETRGLDAFGQPIRGREEEQLMAEPQQLRAFLVELLMRRALVLRLMGNLEAAGSDFLDVLELEPEEGFALFWYGKILIEQQRHQEDRSCYGPWQYGKYSSTPSAQRALHLFFLQWARCWRQAASYLHASIEHHEKTRVDMFGCSGFEWQSTRSKESPEPLTKPIKSKQTLRIGPVAGCTDSGEALASGEAWVVPSLLFQLRVTALCDLCRWEDAVADCRQALLVDPGDEAIQFTMHVSAGILKFQELKFEAAIGCFTKALRLQPVNVQTRLHRAIALACAAWDRGKEGAAPENARVVQLLTDAVQDLEAVDQQAMIAGLSAPLGAAHLRAACLCSLGRPDDAWEALCESGRRCSGRRSNVEGLDLVDFSEFSLTLRCIAVRYVHVYYNIQYI